MVYAQGLGPLHTRSGRALVRWLLARVDRITLRDEASAALLAQLGLSGRAVVTADPVFALSPAPVGQARAILQAEGVSPGEPLLAVSVRPWPTMGEASRQALARALDGAAMGAGARILIVYLHPADDPAAAADLAGRLSSPCTLLGRHCSPSEMASVIGQARALVAMRLHALIFGAISGVPATALSYDPKIDAVALQLGLGPAHDVAAIDPAALQADIEAALDAPPHRRDEIRETAAHYRSLAEENFRILEELLL
jgi:polysaccharide pyruvyl transferase CsaB